MDQTKVDTKVMHQILGSPREPSYIYVVEMPEWHD